jgi:predicted Zn-dependent protease
MKKTFVVLSILGLIGFAISCAKVPISGRRQLHLLPESEMMAMSFQAYKDFLDTNQVLPASNKDVVMVKSIGDRIKNSVESYLTQNKQTNRISGFEWEFNVVQQDVVNAWCMPGGKVVVYTGILPVTQSDAGLAVVMGHEIAHAIARHGNERMSQGLAIQLGGAALSVAMSEKPALTRNIFLQSYGIGSQLGALAYSRNHESEADKLGLVFMAMAGYDPQTAISFWERMAQSGGQAPPEILSTHPSDATRIAGLKEFMPQAMKYYKPAQQ